MRTYRQAYTRNGKTFRVVKWYCEIECPDGARRALPAFTDREASAAFGRKIQKLAERAASHEEPAGELLRFLEDLPDATRARLASWGILDPSRIVRGRPLWELDPTDPEKKRRIGHAAEYLDTLHAAEVSEEHCKELGACIGKYANVLPGAARPAPRP